MNYATIVEELFRLTERQKSALKKLGIATIEDLLLYFPHRYENPADFKWIKDVSAGESVRVWGKVTKIDYEKTWKKKINIAHASIEDATGHIGAVWFRQPYIAKMLPEGSCAIFAGKVSARKGIPYLANPLYEIAPCGVVPQFSSAAPAQRLIPLYPTSVGISSLWLQQTIQKILSRLTSFPDPIPPEILNAYHLPNRAASLRLIHRPKNLAHAEAAKKRFAFEEVFALQLSRLAQKEEIKQNPSFALASAAEYAEEFERLLPFPLTGAQKRAIRDIVRDFESNTPMNRLLEGDVGSGKTAVAACASYIIARNHMQAVYMAPTEILARQHFEGFCKLFAQSGFTIALLTSSQCEKFPSKIDPHRSTHISRAQALRWFNEGVVHILIGTHAIIQKRVSFKSLALAMVDEQHRFGIFQRAALRTKNVRLPHFLSMSATPIPRTLALAVYADLDLTLLDELPAGRKPIETTFVRLADRKKTYEFIRKKLEAGEQAFVICPRIEIPEETNRATIEMKSVKAEYAKIKKEIFPEFEIVLMHGKLIPKEKEAAMKAFRSGKAHIMVSTSVVEVGVDVPNATIMMIEGAERFGLAQLHQFRGRVGRGEKQSYCFVVPTKYSASVFRRLKALTEAKNGFELAEYDLQFRGAGELAGSQQWGFSDVGMEALKNLKMVEAARNEARKIVENKTLDRYPLLQEKINRLSTQPIHLE
ncbi:hypothetical protein A3J56_00540 [Candidatus Giovannonibacteria bacterium RIFCSPHIGHO2_02_FULL_46_20]|uniref:Uncharacterized protein n=1 Tax=Candidatus Giovannonibacteria bacterium RIFCSPHIGHO2_02_FULL_46_20 TaxID=1798338 RepID=A0A1F5WDA9_9BACT|nr:MAG: hypothetical protein A3J56_00540 [Candidatus Giovannonibacteria bacterium RIFCSPHIGHO2_02_FULL_46_20]